MLQRIERVKAPMEKPAVEEIRDAKIHHRRECDPAGMEEAVAEILKL